MKNKILIVLSSFLLVVCFSFLSFSNLFNVRKFSNAEDVSNSSHLVNFYGNNEELLYSYEIEDGKSLDSIVISDTFVNGYTKLSYIESTGTQYFNTDYLPNNKTDFYIDFSVSNSISTSSFVYIFGSFDDRFSLNTYKSFNGGEFYYFKSQYNPYITPNVRTQISLIGNLFKTSNGTVSISRSTSYHSSYPLMLFTRYDADAGVFAKMKLYSFKLFDNSVLVRDFIPCIRNIDGEVGMYDLVNDIFYVNEGSGSFNSGAIIDNDKETLISHVETLYKRTLLDSQNPIYWKTEDNSSYNFSKPVTKDLNLYASTKEEVDYSYENSKTSDYTDINYFNEVSCSLVKIKALTLYTNKIGDVIFLGKYSIADVESGSYTQVRDCSITTRNKDSYETCVDIKVTLNYDVDAINKTISVVLSDFKYEFIKPFPLSDFYFELDYFKDSDFEGVTFNTIYFSNYLSNIKFDLDYSNQYFYNQSFGLFVGNHIRDEEEIPNVVNYKGNSLNAYYITNNDEYYLYSQGGSSILYDYIIMNSIYLTSYYVDSFCFDYGDGVYSLSSWKWSGDYPLSMRYDFSGYYDNHLPLYSGGYSQNSLSSTLIPVNSNDLYKAGEWYDIPVQLYNFLIWIVFDAPLISDFVQLVYIIIQFIISSFEMLLSLFSSVRNTIFISLFFGIIAIGFVFKVIFGGSRDA